MKRVDLSWGWSFSFTGGSTSYLTLHRISIVSLAVVLQPLQLSSFSCFVCPFEVNSDFCFLHIEHGFWFNQILFFLFARGYTWRAALKMKSFVFCRASSGPYNFLCKGVGTSQISSLSSWWFLQTWRVYCAVCVLLLVKSSFHCVTGEVEFVRKKKELRALILKRKHEQYMKDGTTNIRQVGVGHRSLCVYTVCRIQILA